MNKSKLSTKWKLILAIALAIVVLAIAGGTVLARGYFAGNPAACGKCHIMQQWVDSYYTSQFLDNVHSSGQPPAKCEDCHRQSLFQQASELISFVRGDYTVTAKTVDTQASCKSCHQVAQVIEKVQSRPDFIANPKLSYHLNAENAKACRDPRAELVKCQDCHKSHQDGVNYCATCHASSFGTPVVR